MTEAAELGDGTRSERGRLLIVDDDRDIVLTLRAVFEREGYEVATAGSHKEVQEQLKKQTFDAAILDLRLDSEDGFDVFTFLHEHEHGDCSVVILTGFASLESAQEAIRRGAYDYLAKPCDTEELKLVVRRGVERAELARSLRLRMEELVEANRKIEQMAASRQRELEEQVRKRTKELTAANAQLQAEIAERKRAEATIFQLSAPVLRIGAHVLLLPLIGTMTDERSRLVNERLLQAIRDHRAKVVVVDCTGLAEVTPVVADQMLRMTEAAQLLGAALILTGLSTQVTREFVARGQHLKGLQTFNDVEAGIEAASRFLTNGGSLPR